MQSKLFGIYKERKRKVGKKAIVCKPIINIVFHMIIIYNLKQKIMGLTLKGLR